ncbi:MAG: domain S-box [Bacteriovoracaceae bacterium]|nr:domain S-box [Bacteriovoracaceae bacterium]
MESSEEIQKIKILLVESDIKEVKEIIDTLNAYSLVRFEIENAKLLSEAFAKLETQTFDLILVNLSLPDSGGVYTLSKINAKVESIPSIVINGADDEDLALQSIRAGAEDYWIKGQPGAKMLARSIRARIEKVHFAQAKMNALQSGFHAFKMSALATMASDVSGGVEDSLSAVTDRLSVVETSMSEKEVDTVKALELLASAQSAASDLATIIKDLRSFSDVVQKDPEMRRTAPSPDLRFLIVEDEPEIAGIIMRRLEKLGFSKIDYAANGQDAYNLCLKGITEKLPHDVIISDWKVPRLSGLELLHKLRKNHQMKDIPFMMVTALDARDRVAEAVEERVSEYLVKPFKMEDFDRKIKNLLWWSKSK